MSIKILSALTTLSITKKEDFLKKVGEEFDREVAEKDNMIRKMNLHYKFKYGQVVKRFSASVMDKILGIPSVEYGIIVGHSDFENLKDDQRYYRVRTQDGHPFLGCGEDTLEAVTNDEEIPDFLKTIEVCIVAKIGRKRVVASQTCKSQVL